MALFTFVEKDSDNHTDNDEEAEVRWVAVVVVLGEVLDVREAGERGEGWRGRRCEGGRPKLCPIVRRGDWWARKYVRYVRSEGRETGSLECGSRWRPVKKARRESHHPPGRTTLRQRQ